MSSYKVRVANLHIAGYEDSGTQGSGPYLRGTVEVEIKYPDGEVTLHITISGAVQTLDQAAKQALSSVHRFGKEVADSAEFLYREGIYAQKPRSP